MIDIAVTDYLQLILQMDNSCFRFAWSSFSTITVFCKAFCKASSTALFKAFIMFKQTTSRKRRCVPSAECSNCSYNGNVSCSPPMPKRRVLDGTNCNADHDESASATRSKPIKPVVPEPYLHAKITGCTNMANSMLNEEMPEQNNRIPEAAEVTFPILPSPKTTYSTTKEKGNSAHGGATSSNDSDVKATSEITTPVSKACTGIVQQQKLVPSANGKSQRTMEPNWLEVHLKNLERKSLAREIEDLENEAEESRRRVYEQAKRTHVPAVMSFMKEVEKQHGPIGDGDISSVVQADDVMSQRWRHLQAKGQGLQKQIQDRLNLLVKRKAFQAELAKVEREFVQLMKIMTLTNMFDGMAVCNV